MFGHVAGYGVGLGAQKNNTNGAWRFERNQIRPDGTTVELPDTSGDQVVAAYGSRNQASTWRPRSLRRNVGSRRTQAGDKRSFQNSNALELVLRWDSMMTTMSVSCSTPPVSSPPSSTNEAKKPGRNWHALRRPSWVSVGVSQQRCPTWSVK